MVTWPSSGSQFSLISGRYYSLFVGGLQGEAQELLPQEWGGLRRAQEAHGAELLPSGS